MFTNIIGNHSKLTKESVDIIERNKRITYLKIHTLIQKSLMGGMKCQIAQELHHDCGEKQNRFISLNLPL